MVKSTFFTGQPSLRAAGLAEPAQDHRLNHGDPVLQPGIQGRRQEPQAGKEKGRREGPYGHRRKRGGAWRRSSFTRTARRTGRGLFRMLISPAFVKLSMIS